MGKPGKRRNRKQQPSNCSQGEDPVLSHSGEYIFPRAMLLKDPSRFLPCEIGLCRPSTCWHLTRSLKRRLTRTPTDFGEGVRRQMGSKPVSSHSVETTDRNGFSRGISAPASD